MSFRIDGLDHLVINVSDVEVSAAWYQRVLGVTRQDTPGTPVRTSVHFGRQKINLRPVAASKRDWFTAANATVGSDDLCFVTSSDPDLVVSHLRECGVPVELGPGTRLGARGPMTSVYCRDPDGNLIEIATYGKSEA
ncbi:VOC family protein [Bradyrhizobium sp. LHD-71]|uniref:VOC family protein n=1 Tax=Bradyrhizobium sp. LHD-71 TaxID=3072141 RepID=UPI00280D5386|nr:VOC family protein [Bradyrhizobium sp. LHD-71]MDQ8726600.1 VOC family protein [Bradyrhizobium sp. LHD-71]